MSDNPATSNRLIENRGREKRGLTYDPRIQNPRIQNIVDEALRFGSQAPTSKVLFEDLVAEQGIEPITARRAQEIKARWGIIARNVKGSGTLKEQFYREIIPSIGSLRKALIARMRKNPSLAPMADVCDAILDEVTTIVYIVVGMLGESLEQIVTTVPELLQLVIDVIEFLLNVAQTFADGERGQRAQAEVNQTIINLSKVPVIMKARLAEWKTKFEKAPTEIKSVMIGELTVEVLQILQAAVGITKATKKIVKAIKKTPKNAVAGAGKLKPKKQKIVKTPGTTLRREPTLNDAGWGGRPPGAYNNRNAAAYANRVTKSRESIYVGSKGTEFDGYRRSDRILLDAKWATDKGFYDIGTQKFYIYDPNKPIPFQTKKILEEVARQLEALEGSGAAGIEWIINNKRIQKDLEILFKRNSIYPRIKVVWQQ